MLILLPPSETKRQPDAHSPVSTPYTPALTSFPVIAEARAEMAEAAIRTALAADGAAMLGVPSSSPELVERMASLHEEQAAPALSVYTGVLYEALASIAGEALRTTAVAPQDGPDNVDVVVTSALAGAVDARNDMIPAYRLSAGSQVIDGQGTVVKAASWWKKRLGPVRDQLEARHDLIIDCRSGAYQTMMPMPTAYTVRAVREKDGKRSVISHDAKRYRGLLAGALITAPHPPRGIDDVLTLARTTLGHLEVELDGMVLTVVDR